MIISLLSIFAYHIYDIQQLKPSPKHTRKRLGRPSIPFSVSLADIVIAHQSFTLSAVHIASHLCPPTLQLHLKRSHFTRRHAMTILPRHFSFITNRSLRLLLTSLLFFNCCPTSHAILVPTMYLSTRDFLILLGNMPM